MKFIQETDRLIMRVLEPRYAPAVLAFYKRNRLWFEPVEPVRSPNFYTKAYQEHTLTMELNEILHGNYLRLFLFIKNGSSEHIIGSICFNHFRYHSFFSCTMGYKTDHDYWMQGYMKEALSYAINHIIFHEYRMHRIEAEVMPSNTASCKLLECLGFKKEGILHDYAFLQNSWQDHLLYALINRQPPPP